MRKQHRVAWFFAFLLTAFAMPGAGKGRAEELFQKGTKSFAAGQYQVALVSFQGAYAEKQTPMTLLKIAETHQRLGQLSEASRVLELFLRQFSGAKERLEAEKALANVRALGATREKLKELKQQKQKLNDEKTSLEVEQLRINQRRIQVEEEQRKVAEEEKRLEKLEQEISQQPKVL